MRLPKLRNQNLALVFINLLLSLANMTAMSTQTRQRWEDFQENPEMNHL